MTHRLQWSTLMMPALFTGIVWLAACKDNDKRLAAYLKDDFPTQIVDSFTNRYIDFGQVKMLLKAPMLIEYDNKKRRYREFPDGIEIQWFKARKLQGLLRADYAIMYLSDTATYEARGNVLVVTPDKDTILTSRIIWDRAKKRFYSRAKTTILSKGSVLPSEGGFEASEDLSRYRLLKPRNGKIKVKTDKEKKH